MADEERKNKFFPCNNLPFPCLQVVATDADANDYGMVRYSLSDGFERQDRHPLFHINPVSGELCVDQDIDRDSAPATHDLLVKAEDQVSGDLLVDMLY